MALTCFIGESKIISTNYGKEDLRKWSNKGILKCDCCGTKMIYKHGDFKVPHFAHTVSNCGLQYYEPESEEHINGKLTIYNWLITQDVQNLELESWIPETKQRPDIYFEKNGKRFVIEFQCTPIATEFNERRKLYKLAGINDIWILGFDKFDFNRGELNGDFLGHIFRYDTKVFERELLCDDKKIIHMVGSKIIPFLDSHYAMVTDVVGYRFETCTIDIFDLTFEDLLNTKYFKDTISSSVTTRIHMSNLLNDFKNLMKYEKYANILRSLRNIMDRNGFGELKDLTFKNGNNLIKFKLFENIKLITNKTHHSNIECGNYIVSDKIVTITSTEKRTFWNYGKKFNRPKTDVWYLNKVVQSIYDFDVNLLYCK